MIVDRWVPRVMLLIASAAALAASLSGCMTLAALSIAQEERERARLSQPAPSEYAWATETGVTITGVVRLPTTQTEPFPGGVRRGPREVLTCEGRRVRLIPDTPHLRFVLEETFDLRVESGGYWQSGFIPREWAWPPESISVVRETRCTADGAFTFENVPDGEWLVMAEINPPSYDGGVSATDTVVRAVTVRSRGRPVHLDVQIGGNDYVHGAIQRH